MPTCFAVEVDASLNATHMFGGRQYCFASCVVLDAVNLGVSSILANPSTAQSFFKSQEWQSVVILDTLVANSDRTPFNLLLDTSERLWAVDHEMALGGDWEVEDLQRSRHSTNLLARPGASVPTEVQRYELLRKVEARVPSLPLKELASLLPPIGLLSDDKVEALSLYVATRLAELGR